MPPRSESDESPTGLPAMLTGLAEIIDAYDGLILDLWGVLHDGVQPYPGVIDCLQRLRRAGKRCCLLSNAPRRVASAVARLNELGIVADLYDHVLTSGEVTHQALRDPPDEFHAALGSRCLHIGPPRDNDVHQGLGLTLTDRPEDADFVLNTGVDTVENTVADFAGVLAAAAARDLPMICANPDLIVMFGGSRMICAGLLAQHYEALGGRVAYHGKPYAPVYRSCRALLDGIDARRLLVIGDSLRTDIAGAKAAGLDAVLVTGGIHAEELGVGQDGRPDPRRLAAVIAESKYRPDMVMPGLRW